MIKKHISLFLLLYCFITTNDTQTSPSKDFLHAIQIKEQEENRIEEEQKRFEQSLKERKEKIERAEKTANNQIETKEERPKQIDEPKKSTFGWPSAKVVGVVSGAILGYFLIASIVDNR